ncbi:MAG TPA: hypothetical protein G4O20_02720 [Dehalococcoidia bacterium]|nr:hypothetical protein [Dehalococcoidia bacterium]
MSRYVQTHEELLKHLKSQIEFMMQSAASFDNGFEDEAKRLAVVIRVLVHDTSNSKSLLTLLDNKNIKLYDSALSYDPKNLLPFSALTMMKVSTEGASYVAPLDGGAPSRSRTRKIAFQVWWDGVFVIKDKHGKTFTRKQLVLNTANMDGGAHVDPNLDEAYAKLSRFQSLGWKFFNRGIEDDFRNSPVLPSVRQIAHEVLKTLRDEFPKLF